MFNIFAGVKDKRFIKHGTLLLILGFLAYYLYCVTVGEQVNLLTTILPAETGWAIPDITNILTYGSLASVVLVFVINTLFMKVDAKKLMVVATLITAVCFAAMGFSSTAINFAMFFVSFFVLRIIIVVLQHGTNLVCNNWWGANRGKALGIPAYRLPREALMGEIAEITAVGVTLKTGQNVTSITELKEDYDAVLAAVGAAQGKRLPLAGANDSQCATALEVLRSVSLTGGHPLLVPGRRVTVLGGGNVAFDAARTALRLGAQVRVVCLEDREHMLADEEEIVQAGEEGAALCPGRHNLELVTEGGTITALRTERITGFRFTPGGLEVDSVPGSGELFPTDAVIFAAGQKSDLTPAFGLPLNQWGYPEHDGCATAVEGVFVAGDAVTGTKAVIDAIAAGREAAREMDRYLGGDGCIDPPPVQRQEKGPCLGKQEGFARLHRARAGVRDPEARKGCWDKVDLGYSEAQARAEAERCLSCPLRTQISASQLWTAYLPK